MLQHYCSYDILQDIVSVNGAIYLAFMYTIRIISETGFEAFNYEKLSAAIRGLFEKDKLTANTMSSSGNTTLSMEGSSSGTNPNPSGSGPSTSGSGATPSGSGTNPSGSGTSPEPSGSSNSLDPEKYPPLPPLPG
jgi:hypothetical protein